MVYRPPSNFACKINKKKALFARCSDLFCIFAKEFDFALNTDKNLKLYFSIKEVAEEVGVTESNLRFWEKEIPSLKPKTTGNNVRQYTAEDIENIKTVYNLVKVRGFKIAAAKKMLSANKVGVDKNARVMEGLIKVREELKDLKKHLDSLV